VSLKRKGLDGTTAIPPGPGRRGGRILRPLLALALLLSACSAAKTAPGPSWQRSSPDGQVAGAQLGAQLARDQRECEHAVALSNLDGKYAHGMMIQCLEDRGWEQQAARPR
jgi:hypothetical protein